jgi:hypothetical protein
MGRNSMIVISFIQLIGALIIVLVVLLIIFSSLQAIPKKKSNSSSIFSLGMDIVDNCEMLVEGSSSSDLGSQDDIDIDLG